MSRHNPATRGARGRFVVEKLVKTALTRRDRWGEQYNTGTFEAAMAYMEAHIALQGGTWRIRARGVRGIAPSSILWRN